jgi:hypothetical protein
MWRNSSVLRIGGKILESGSRALLEVANFLRGYNYPLETDFRGFLFLCIKQWVFQQLNVDISLTRMKKADTSNEKFHQEALSALEKYDLVFYTDGSKIGEAVGYLIVNENQTFGKHIDKM